jgi:hypothetical protein
MPQSFKLDNMLDGALGKGERENAQAARVLAWQIDEDDRPLRVESVILWIALADKPAAKKPTRWMLAHLYRHPRDENEWRISRVYDAPFVGTESYESAPKRAELDRFLKDTWWHFKPLEGFRSLGAEVCRDAWAQAFGAPPWHSYSL